MEKESFDIEQMKILAFAYFDGAIALPDEKILFRFLSESKANKALFEEWENEWQQMLNQSFTYTDELNLLNRKIRLHKVMRKPSNKIAGKVAKWTGITIAASIFVFLSLKLSKAPQATIEPDTTYITIEAPLGEKSKAVLTDGSQVWLNSGTKLLVPSNFSQDRRRVSIEGEAFFEVTSNPQKPFVVETKHYNIEVTGTGFDVSAYPDDAITTTTLLHGKITIHYNDNEIGLEPGDEMRYNTETKEHTISRSNTMQAGAWTQNRIEYDNITLAELLKKLSRQYNTPIYLENEQLASKPFSVSLRNQEKLTDVLMAISKIIPINIEVNNQTIIVK